MFKQNKNTYFLRTIFIREECVKVKLTKRGLKWMYLVVATKKTTYTYVLKIEFYKREKELFIYINNKEFKQMGHPNFHQLYIKWDATHNFWSWKYVVHKRIFVIRVTSFWNRLLILTIFFVRSFFKVRNQRRWRRRRRYGRQFSNTIK